MSPVLSAVGISTFGVYRTITFSADNTATVIVTTVSH